MLRPGHGHRAGHLRGSHPVRAGLSSDHDDYGPRLSCVLSGRTSTPARPGVHEPDRRNAPGDNRGFPRQRRARHRSRCLRSARDPLPDHAHNGLRVAEDPTDNLGKPSGLSASILVHVANAVHETAAEAGRLADALDTGPALHRLSVPGKIVRLVSLPAVEARRKLESRILLGHRRLVHHVTFCFRRYLPLTEVQSKKRARVGIELPIHRRRPRGWRACARTRR